MNRKKRIRLLARIAIIIIAVAAIIIGIALTQTEKAQPVQQEEKMIVLIPYFSQGEYPKK